jgi:hypothetical protein
MEMSQGNDLCSYLKQTKTLFLSFSKSENRRRVEQSFLGPVEGGRMWEKGVGLWTWWKHYVLVYVNGKMRTFGNIPGMGEWGIKENDGSGEL